MKKKELEAWIAKEINMSKKDAAEFLEKLTSKIKETVKKDKEGIQLFALGKFVVVDRKARLGRNPATGEKINIPASKKLKFKPSKEFKEAIK